MKTIRELLGDKHHDIFSIEPAATVHDALVAMAKHNVGALMTLEAGRLVGIISERDYARRVVLTGATSRDVTVREIMSVNLITVTPDKTVEDCMALMLNGRVRHLPVFDRDELIGVISIRDVVKASLDEKDFVIEQMEHYITGQR